MKQEVFENNLSNVLTDDIFMHFDEVEPNIFHYTSPNSLLGIMHSSDNHPIGRAKLWFTQYDCLNDKSERKDILSIIEDYCNLQLKNKKLSPEFVKLVKELKPSDFCTITIEKKTNIAYAKDADSFTYLCCFSTNPDSLPMWNYYTKNDKYEGYNIGFHSCIFKHNTCYQQGYDIEIKKVIYSRKRKYALLDALLIPLFNLYNEANSEQKK